MKAIWPYVILCGIALSACSSTQKPKSYLGYSESAQSLFEEGMIAYERERWTEAAGVFEEVERQYPYSKYAPLAEIRAADCHFALGSHAEAAVEYQHFIKAYPTHELAHYAAFKKGMAYYEQIPGEWFLTPPAHEKDQTATRDARAALGKFLNSYPKSEYIEQAKEVYTEVENSLVKHEMYVARFYLDREKRKAAAVRLESIGKQFPSSPLVPDAMFLQAITFLEMGKESTAKRTFDAIIRMYPEHYQAHRAKKYLKSLQTKSERAQGNNG